MNHGWTQIYRINAEVEKIIFLPDLQMLNGRGRNILPGGAFSNHLHPDHLSSQSINVDESNGNSRNTKREQLPAGDMAAPFMIDFNKDNTPVRATLATQLRLINPNRAMMPPGEGWIGSMHLRHPAAGDRLQVLKRVEYPVGYKRESVMFLMQMEFTAGIGDHTLHDIVAGHQISQIILSRV